MDSAILLRAIRHGWQVLWPDQGELFYLFRVQRDGSRRVLRFAGGRLWPADRMIGAPRELTIE